jgi:hypothetical protein
MVERPMRQQRINGTLGKTEWMPSAIADIGDRDWHVAEGPRADIADL